MFKRIGFLLIGAFVGLILGIFYANYTIKPMYYASSNLIITTDYSSTHLAVATSLFKSDKVISEAITILSDEGITKYSNEQLTADIIRNGVSANYTINSPTISVTFRGHDYQLTDNVANALIKAAVKIGNEDYTIFNSSLIIGELSNLPIAQNGSKFAFYALGIGIGVVFSGMIVLVVTYLSNRTIFPPDYLDSEIATNIIQLKPRNISSPVFSEEMKKLICILKSPSTFQNTTVIGVFSPNFDYSTDWIIFTLGEQFLKQGYKTLIFDTCVSNGGLQEIIAKQNHAADDDKTRKLAIQNIESILERNFDYYQLESKIIPSQNRNHHIAGKLIEFKKTYDLVIVRMAPLSLECIDDPILDEFDRILININIWNSRKDLFDNFIEANIDLYKGKMVVNFINFSNVSEIGILRKKGYKDGK